MKISIESELFNYKFYFKVFSIGIIEEFLIGKVVFTSLTKDFFEKEFKELQINKSEGVLNKIYSDYTKSVIAISSGYATKDKAFDIAFNNVELALNAIKCCLIIDSLNKNILLPLLNEIPQSRKFVSYMFKPENLDRNMQFAFVNGPSSTEINLAKLKVLRDIGLEKISKFLNTQSDTELSWKIIGIIKLMGDVNSTSNLHERVVKLISLHESFLIPQGDLKAKGLTRLKTLIKNLKPPNQDNLLKIVTKLYDVRDKFLHNKNEIRIDLNHLYDFQIFTLFFICKLIDFNSEFNDVETLLKIILVTN